MKLVRNNRTNIFDLMENIIHETSTGMFSKVPSVNIREDEKGYAIEMAAPGLNKDLFELNIKDDQLKVSYKAEKTNEESKVKYTKVEYKYDSFARVFTLPELSNTAEISAAYTDGILTVSIPKDEKKELVKTIKVS